METLDFIEAKNQQVYAQQPTQAFVSATPEFVGKPEALPLPSREEMIYRYQYLDETIPSLARRYRVTPRALTAYFESHNVHRVTLETEEDYEQFQSYTNQLYRDIRVRMSGLVALQSAKAWETLAVTEDNLLASVKAATQNLQQRMDEGYSDIKGLKQLTDTHIKLVDRQDLIKRAIEKPAEYDVSEIANSLSEELKSIMESTEGKLTLPSEDKKE